MVFFVPSDATRRDLARDVGEELAVFGVGGRIRESGPALTLVDDEAAIHQSPSAAPAPRIQRALRKETRSAYRPMVLADERDLVEEAAALERLASRAGVPAAAQRAVSADSPAGSAAIGVNAAASVLETAAAGSNAAGTGAAAPSASETAAAGTGAELASATGAAAAGAAAPRAERIAHGRLAPARPVGVWRLRRQHAHELRVLADSNDRRAWLEQRARGVTATDAAKLATDASVKQVVRDKVRGTGFTGNAYTDFGRQREPHIAAWVAERHGIEPCGLLYHAERSRQHLATPDGLFCDEDGRVVLAEIKTTNKPWSRIPRGYLRQVWWQQYVLGAERTLFVWERHRDFVVVDEEPKSVWIERDESEIERLAALADRVLEEVASLRVHLEPPY